MSPADLSGREQALLIRAEAFECQALRGEALPADADVRAAIGCHDLSEPAYELSIHGFRDTDAMRDRWDDLTSATKPRLRSSDAACDGGERGLRSWGFGDVACDVQDGVATMRWTDRRTRSVATLVGGTDDIAALYGWWRDNGRPLGRPLETPLNPENASPEPGSSSEKLQRVPGRPKDLVCESSTEPIVDLADRTWTVRKVTVRNRPRYERVVIQLRRNGRNRGEDGTAITIRRFPVEQIKRNAPNAPRPRSGDVVLRVRMDGVDEAPRIRRFRPSGASLIDEISLLRNKQSTSAIIATPNAACYEVRVPVFGPAASGRENTAKVFIDFQQRPASARRR